MNDSEGPSRIAAEILQERHRQIKAEGWSPAHDDFHLGGELAKAAACYALNAALPPITREVAQIGGSERVKQLTFLRRYWPWEPGWWKPKDRRRDLIRAGALILAEIERLDRMGGAS